MNEIINQIVINIREYIGANRPVVEDINRLMYMPCPAVTFGDVSVSIQASSSHYCLPREDNAEWTAVELGFPTKKPPDYIMEHIDGSPDYWNESVYSYVPIEDVARWIYETSGRTKLIASK